MAGGFPSLLTGEMTQSSTTSPPHYTPFGWVDDDVNFKELVAMNPGAHENAIKMQQAQQLTNNATRTAMQNTKVQHIPFNTPPSIPTLMRRMPALPASSYVASAGGGGGKSGKSVKKADKTKSKK
jgi:hypothetical protein